MTLYIYLHLHLNLHLYLHLLKNRLIAIRIKSLRGIAMATVKNWPFGTESGQKLTDYLTTGPVSTMSRKDIRAAGFQKQSIRLLMIKYMINKDKCQFNQVFHGKISLMISFKNER